MVLPSKVTTYPILVYNNHHGKKSPSSKFSFRFFDATSLPLPPQMVPKGTPKNSQFSVRRNHLVFQSRNLWSKGESWLAFTPVLISCCQMRRCVSLRLKARLEPEKNHEDQPGAIAEVAKMVPTFLGSTEYRINGRATKTGRRGSSGDGFCLFRSYFFAIGKEEAAAVLHCCCLFWKLWKLVVGAKCQAL